MRLLHNQNYIKGQELEQLQMRVGDNDIMLENLDMQKNNLEREGEEKVKKLGIIGIRIIFFRAKKSRIC